MFFLYNQSMPTYVAPSSGRLDAFLVSAGAVRSRSQAKEVIEVGAVTVAGEVARKPKHRVWEGQTVEIAESALTEQRASGLAAVDLGLTILYEDDACLVIDKPYGTVVHPAIGVAKDEPTILHGAAHLFAERGLPFSEEGILVHRLDRETTGCLLLAKSMEAHAALQKQFAARTVRKQYLALVAGTPDPAAAVIDAPVGRSTVDRTKMAVLGASAARSAKTTYRTLGSGSGAALVLCDLHTGRTHQVRIHLRTIGHPILGDPSYVTPESEALAQVLGIERLCLHAWKLAFDSPAAGRVEISAPLSEAFERALERAGIANGTFEIGNEK